MEKVHVLVPCCNFSSPHTGKFESFSKEAHAHMVNKDEYIREAIAPD